MNPAEAEWCGQCLRRFPPAEMKVDPIESPADILFGEEEAGSLNAGDAAVIEQMESQLGTAAEPAAPQSKLKPAKRGAFTVTEEGINWTCEKCDAVNPLEAQYCSICGSSFAEMLRPNVERPQRDPNMAALVSLFFPGAGHMYLKMWAQGIARAVVSAWVGAVALLALIAGGRANSSSLAVTVGAVSLALWVLGAHDAYREARGEPSMVILKGKVFLYTVLGLLMLLFFLLLGAGLNARGG